MVDDKDERMDKTMIKALSGSMAGVTNHEDDWMSDVAELIRRLDIAVAALENIASYNDTMAQKIFNKTGNFDCFDEPVSTKTARTALLKMEVASFGEVTQ